MPTEHHLEPPYPEGVMKKFDRPSGYHDMIQGMCALKDGRIVAVGSGILMNVWDPRTGQRIKTLNGHTGHVNSVCALDTPEGERVVSASDDGTLRVWDIEAEEPLYTLENRDPDSKSDLLTPVKIVCTLDNKKGLVVCGTYRNFWVWNIVTGKLLQKLECKIDDFILNICVLEGPDTTYIVGYIRGGIIKIWSNNNNDTTWTPLKDIREQLQRTKQLCALDKRYIVSGNLDGTLTVYDSWNNWRIQTLTVNKDKEMIDSICAIGEPGSQYIVTASNGQPIRIWDINKENPKILKIVLEPRIDFDILAEISPTRFASASRLDGVPVIWDISNLESFPKPSRSGIFQRGQNAIRGTLRLFKRGTASVAPMNVSSSAALPVAPSAAASEASSEAAEPPKPKTAWQGGVSRKKRKTRKTKRKGKSRKSRY
jgi:WD40 repeat protein